MDSERASLLARQYGSGFWKAGSECFFNKAEALRYSTAYGMPVTYHFFDEIYARNKGEPQETLTEIYKQRALQIRSQYDYVVLALSGGSDSTNMLEAFLATGCKIDEVLCYYPVKAIEKMLNTFDPSDTSPKNHMFEYTMAFTPIVNELLVKHPNIKVTVLDYTDYLLETVDKLAVDSFYLSGLSLHPGTAGTSMVFQHMEKLPLNSVCVVGVDKPRVYYNGSLDRFSFSFMDFQNFWPTACMALKLHPCIEQFYYTPDMPEIIHKQYYVIRRLMRRLIQSGQRSNPLYQQIRRDHPTAKNVDLYNMQDPFFENILYPNTYRPDIFQTVKPKSIFFIEESDWFTKSGLTGERVKSIYEGQVADFLNNIGQEFVTYTDDGKPAMFKHIGTASISFPE
jgi:hypothetical protein